MNSINELADRYVERYAALDPCSATLHGLTGPGVRDGEMSDFGPDGIAARAELARRTLAELDAQPPGPARAAMRERLALELELHEADLVGAELNVIDSPLQALRMVFDLMPTDGEDAWADIASRMRGFPGALASYRRGLAEAAGRGQVAARRQVEGCARICDQWAGRGRQPFFSELAERYGDGPRRPELDRLAGAANGALREFGAFLRERLAPLAPERDAVGRDRYALWSRFHLGAALDLDETYAWGWAELDRITTQLREVAGQIVPSGDRDEAMAALDADPARRVEGIDALRGWMQDLSDRTVEALSGVHFEIPEPARRLECRIAPTHEGGIYYTMPSEDFSRPGRMWWSVPEGVTRFGTWRETTTVFHEGVPGHHLQNSWVVWRSDVLNRYQRTLLWVPGHGEGWALYAERLMEELGYLDDPGDRLGMLDAQAMRAARVVVDIGMHLELPVPAGTGFHEGERWTPELGLVFLRRHCAMNEAYLRNERDRYLGWPGQAPAYKVGEREWLAAREDARRRHGAAFDLKAFHTAALDLGSMGLDPLRAELARL